MVIKETGNANISDQFEPAFLKTKVTMVLRNYHNLKFAFELTLVSLEPQLVFKETKLGQNGPWLALTCFYSRLQLLKFLSHSSQENVVQLMLSHFLVSNSYTPSLSTASALK
jgi:hypothetical protein